MAHSTTFDNIPNIDGYYDGVMEERVKHFRVIKSLRDDVEIEENSEDNYFQLVVTRSCQNAWYQLETWERTIVNCSKF